MNRCILFEIPIYMLKEDDFYEKWEKKKNEFISHQMKWGETKTEANDGFIRCYRYEYLWQYNKLIGFVRIRYDSNRGDLVFDVYKQNKKMCYNKVNKMKFNIISGPNMHIFVRNKSKNYIIGEIEKELNYINDTFFDKSNYFDTKAFYSIIPYLDIEKIIKDEDSH